MVKEEDELEMRSRPFYFLTCALALVATVVDGASKVDSARAASSAARAAAAQSPEDRASLHSVAHLYAVQADRLSVVAVVVLVLALGGWVCSLWRRENGLQSVPLLLLFLAGLLQLLMV